MKKLIGLSIIFIFALPQLALASIWQDLWKTPNQQGGALLSAAKPNQAAKRFSSSDWRGVAHYRAGNYLQAEEDFTKQDTATAWYNRGNALAYREQYKKSIAAYQQALSKQPDMQDAKHNLDVVKKLLNKQQQQSSKQQKQQQQKTAQAEQQKKSQAGKDKQKQSPKQKPTPSSAQQARNQQQQQENLKQWLERIPDDPGGLLRQKFLRDHMRYQQRS